MQRYKNDLKITLIVMSIAMSIFAFIAAPNTMAESGNQIISTTREEISPPVTGQVDRIGSGEIVINDTFFKLSDDVSVSGFKKGDLVTFIANSNRELLKIQHGEIKKQTRE